MAFGNPWHGLTDSGFFGNFIGQPGAVLGHASEQGVGSIPLLNPSHFDPTNKAPLVDFPQSSLVYFQFVFAAITPLLYARFDPRPGQLQGVDPVRGSLVDLRLHRQRVPDLGRRLLRAEGRDRLLRRLRDPSLRRRVRIRRRVGDRPTTCPRPRDRRAEQPADGRRRRRPPVARLERLQRRRSLQRRPGRLVGRAEHEPRHGRRVPRVGRL